MYHVRILKAASRDLAHVDKPVGRRIVERINWLAGNLDVIQPEALTGDLTGLYKLRVGDYRVIYEVVHSENAIMIHAIGHRREIYRKR
jgi:mRNA interferase RelE/StbE